MGVILTNKKISYNFTPSTQIYSSENGTEQDAYFYQRDDRWIFGGSRQKGTIDKHGNWIGEQVLEYAALATLKSKWWNMQH